MFEKVAVPVLGIVEIYERARLLETCGHSRAHFGPVAAPAWHRSTA